MTVDLLRVTAVCLLLALAGCSGSPGATGTPVGQTETPTPTVGSTATEPRPASATPTQTGTAFPRGGLLILSPANDTTAPAVAYDPDEFGEVPALNRTVVEVARTNESATAELSAAELDAVDAFVDAHTNATTGTFPVRMGNTTVEVSIAREA